MPTNLYDKSYAILSYRADFESLQTCSFMKKIVFKLNVFHSGTYYTS